MAAVQPNVRNRTASTRPFETVSVMTVRSPQDGVRVGAGPARLGQRAGVARARQMIERAVGVVIL